MNSPTSPFISVIIPCLNRKDFIGECLESIRSQNYANCEVIVVDGGSTDGTQRVIAQFPEVKVISEKDHGIYDAMNKGLRKSRGSIIAMLNSDDILPKEVFSEISAQFIRDPELDCVVGHCANFKEKLTEPLELNWVQDCAEKLDFSIQNAAFHFCCTNSRFFHRRVYEKVGAFRWEYSIAADREFFIRVILSRAIKKKAHLEKTLMLYRYHSGSLTYCSQPPIELIAIEHLRMIPKLLVEFSNNISSLESKTLKKWHSVESVNKLVFEFKRKDVLSVLKTAAKAWRFDPFFPRQVALRLWFYMASAVPTTNSFDLTRFIL